MSVGMVFCFLAFFGASGANASVSCDTMTGKVLCGYQGWFTAPGDGSGTDFSSCNFLTNDGLPSDFYLRRVGHWTKILREKITSEKNALANGLSNARSPEPPANLRRRGLVAIQKEGGGVFLSWRFWNTDADDTTFTIFRDGQKIADTQRTNYTDPNGTGESAYRVEVAGEASDTVRPWQGFLRIPVEVPPEQKMPDGSVATYTANDVQPADLDGDGRLDLVVKWNPSNAKDNSHSGHTGTTFLDGITLDGTRLWRIDLGRNLRSGAHYTPFIAEDLDGDGRAEIVVKTADGTRDGRGRVLGNADADYRNAHGKILSGPEFLTVFDGRDGHAVCTVDYLPTRDVLSDREWGDDYGNRCDRFLACVGNFGGKNLSVVLCRGYYTAAFLAAYDFDGKTLKLRWFHESKTPGEGLYGEGNHNLCVGDLDGDGRDEIVYGSAALDDDGTLLYRTGLGHGDAIHLGDFDPDRPGLEVWSVHEQKHSPYGYELRSADGKILWGAATGSDVGRGMAADLIPEIRGSECWSSGADAIFDVRGTKVAARAGVPYCFRIYWDGDLGDELLDGTTLYDWQEGRCFPSVRFHRWGAAANNGSKNTPCLSCDLLGDWREEVLFRNGENPGELLLFTTEIPTEYRVPWLFFDPVYRRAVSTQNVGYNQPPHLGYFLPDTAVSGSQGR
ncbi:MAG: rhamnogalacturonan lyase [Planctomycetia bacterium]|nr:rhamnogalacturonan lyase [Planctomycetia bacterium]